MNTFAVVREHCPIDDAGHWFSVGAPLMVKAEDAVWAALDLFRKLRLQPGRDRLVVDGRCFQPGTVD